MEKRMLLVGTGYMAREYAKVLEALHCQFDVVGRSASGCKKFFNDFPGIKVTSGGIERFNAAETYTHAIVASNVEVLKENTISLIRMGIKQILLEKPGGKNKQEINELADLANETNATVLLAYNRRFYASVLKAKNIIEEDGGASSYNFEFTEWAHIVEPLSIGQDVKENWVLANSTHVIDTAYFLGGTPASICCYNSGGLNWHKSSSCFSGAGIAENGALFSYQANWKAPGRWGVEILTTKHRLILKPMEALQIQELASVVIKPVELEDSLDKDFKPGIYLQTEAFLNGKWSSFCDIHQQKHMVNSFYAKMAGYQ